jgi:hypothetical protein
MAEPLIGVAVTFAGAPGTVAGVVAFDAVDGTPVPALLVAVTVNVYAVPLANPVTVAVVVEPGTVAVAPPGEAVTV